MTEKQWIEYLKRSKGWSIRMGHDLLHSQAYQNLKYAPALKVLNWCHEKIRFKVDKKRRGFARYQIVNDGEFTFPYSEAIQRGLTVNQFSRALKDLYGFGFIDVKQFGSGMMENPTIFTLSQRWKEFGKPEFISKEWPKSDSYGFRGRLGKIRKQHAKLHVDQHAKLHVDGVA
jgi:hypothetical protein